MTATATNGVEFLFPTQGVTLHYNDHVQVKYESNFADPWLYTFCESSAGDVNQKGSQSAGGYNNTATIKLDWSGSDTPCWFDLKPNSTSAVGTGANSEQWSFDVSQRAATTVGLQATTTTTSSTGSSGTSSSPSSSSSASTGSTGQSSGLSTGAQAGIGVGVAIAGIALGAAAVVLIMRRRRRQRAERGAAAARIEAHGPGGGSSSGADEMKYPGGHPARQGVSPMSEADGGYHAAHELHAAPNIYELPTRGG